MNDWYELTQTLETDLQPLDELTQKRIEARVRKAFPRRKKRFRTAVAIAAVLILTAGGYAAATGQFSDWFWNVSNLESPETDEDLLASMGTVIGQSQTADGVTATLHGALWDGTTLMLSVTLEGEGVPQNIWANVESENSWLRASRAQMMKSYLEQYPDADEAELDANLEKYWNTTGRWFQPSIHSLYNRDTGTCFLEIEKTFTSQSDSMELVLHLENLSFYNSGEVLKGPFDFTFTVQRRFPQVIYNGNLTLEQENSVDLHITQVTLTPFNAAVAFEVPGRMTQEEFESDWMVSSLTGLRSSGETLGFSNSKSWTGQYDEDSGAMSGSLRLGPFHRVVDPSAVDAVGINDTWLELDSFTLTEKSED